MCGVKAGATGDCTDVIAGAGHVNGPLGAVAVGGGYAAAGSSDYGSMSVGAFVFLLPARPSLRDLHNVGKLANSAQANLASEHVALAVLASGN